MLVALTRCGVLVSMVFQVVDGEAGMMLHMEKLKIKQIFSVHFISLWTF